jgi:hypothetical protein
MFELCNDKLSCGFRWMVSPDPGLDVVLQFVKRYTHAFSVCLAYPLIATNESSERNRFRSRKRGVPTRSMFHRSDRFPIVVFVFVRHAVLNKLPTCLRVLSLA